MNIITSKNQLFNNIYTLESYLTGDDGNARDEAKLLVKRGTCFVAYKNDHEIHFAPSRFIGYIENNLEKHSINFEKHGTFTNHAIKKILGSKPFPNEQLNLKYMEYCMKLGILPPEKGSFGGQRKFWQVF